MDWCIERWQCQNFVHCFHQLENLYYIENKVSSSKVQNKLMAFLECFCCITVACKTRSCYRLYQLVPHVQVDEKMAMVLYITKINHADPNWGLIEYGEIHVHVHNNDIGYVIMLLAANTLPLANINWNGILYKSLGIHTSSNYVLINDHESHNTLKRFHTRPKPTAIHECWRTGNIKYCEPTRRIYVMDIPVRHMIIV